MVNSIPVRDPARALEFKEMGNKCFQAGDYVGAQELYSKAIKYDPSNPLLYTNLAMSLLKLSHYTLVIPAAQQAISLSPDNMKAYFQLSQAQIALNYSQDALASSLLAHKYCVEEIHRGGKGGSSIGPVTELVLKCKKLDWERREAARLRDRKGLLEELIERLQGAKDMEVIEVTTSGTTGPEGIRELESEWDAKIELLRSTFDSAAGNESDAKRREVPDWCVDDITFGIMVDPVTTKTGQSYDRSSIMEHLKRSPTDPLTRDPLKIEDLRPNLALRQACEEFLEKNGWAVDW